MFIGRRWAWLGWGGYIINLLKIKICISHTHAKGCFVKHIFTVGLCTVHIPSHIHFIWFSLCLSMVVPTQICLCIYNIPIKPNYHVKAVDVLQKEHDSLLDLSLSVPYYYFCLALFSLVSSSSVLSSYVIVYVFCFLRVATILLFYFLFSYFNDPLLLIELSSICFLN